MVSPYQFLGHSANFLCTRLHINQSYDSCFMVETWKQNNYIKTDHSCLTWPCEPPNELSRPTILKWAPNKTGQNKIYILISGVSHSVTLTSLVRLVEQVYRRKLWCMLNELFLLLSVTNIVQTVGKHNKEEETHKP